MELMQRGCRAPPGAGAFEEWSSTWLQKHMDENAASESQRRKRVADVSSWQQRCCAGAAAREEKNLPSGGVQGTAMRLADGSCLDAAEQPLPVTASQQDQEALASRLGLGFAGTCGIDVDVTWRQGLEQTKRFGYKADVSSLHQRPWLLESRLGQLEILLRSARVPPCNEGLLQVRVCEVGLPTVASSTGLESKRLVNPLWLSSVQPLGYHGLTCCAAWRETAVLSVQPCLNLLHSAQKGWLDDTAPQLRLEDAEAYGLPVDFAWTPLTRPHNSSEFGIGYAPQIAAT